MKDPLTEFALLFKERDNRAPTEITTGTVISSSPVKIRLSEVIILDSEQIIVAERVTSSLTVGAEVILIPTNDQQLYYVIDKVVYL